MHNGIAALIPLGTTRQKTINAMPKDERVNPISHSTIIYLEEYLRELARLIARDEFYQKDGEKQNEANKTQRKKHLLTAIKCYNRAKEGKLDIFKNIETSFQMREVEKLFGSNSKSKAFEDTLNSLAESHKNKNTERKNSTTTGK